MAGVDVRISELPAATEGHPDDRFETTQVDGATLVSRSITLEQVSDAVAAVLPPPAADWDSITGKPATFPPTIPTGPAIATWPYLPLTGGTLTGTLNGTISNWTGKLTVNVADAAPAVLFRGVSKGVRFLASATEYAIEGVDQSGSGSFQPLRISGTEVRFGIPVETMRLDATGLGIGIMPALSKLHLKGTGQTSASVDTSTSLGATAYLQDTGAAVGNGGMLLFGASQGAFATIKGLIGNGGSNTTGDLVVSTRRATADATLTETARFGFAGNTALAGALTGTTATMAGAIKAQSATAIPAGGTAGAGFTFSSTANFGTIFGSGAPTASAARGSIYLRSDGGGPYVNTDGATAWSAVGGAVSVGTTAPSSPTDGQLWYYSDAVNGGGSLYIRYNDGNTTQWVPASPAATPGSLLQTVFTETGAVATGTTIIPFDDTIPQITEGDQYMTLAITPRSATSKLIIEVTAHLMTSSAVGGTMAAALFQDSTANALACGYATAPTAAASNLLSFKHVMTSGTTSATTFRVRGGFAAAGTTTFNGYGGGRLYGGVMASSIVIQEVA